MSDAELPPTDTAPITGNAAPQPAVGPGALPETNGDGSAPAGETAVQPPAPTTATGEQDGSVGGQGVKPAKSETPPAAEAQPTKEEVERCWDGEEGACQMVLQNVKAHPAEYNTDAKARRFFAKSKKLDARKPDDLAIIDAEMDRRKRVLEALEIVEIALKVERGEKTDWKKGAKSGCFQKLSPDGKTVEREVWTHWAVEPIIDEVRKFAKETEIKDGTDIPTKRAEQALIILKVIEPRLVPVTTIDRNPGGNPEGRKGFIIEPDLNKIEIKKAQEAVIPFAYHVLDALLEPFGRNLEHITDGKPPRTRLVLDVEEWKKIGTSEEIGTRLSELSVLLTQYEDVDVSQYPEARANLAALIYDGVSQLYEKGVSSKIHDGLAKDYEDLKKYDSVFQNTRKALINKVKDTFKQYYFKGQQIDPETIKFLETNLFHDLCFAYICQGHVKFNPSTRAVEFEENLQNKLDDERAKGWIYTTDIQAIIALAAEKRAEQMLKDDLGFNLDHLKDQPISAYANRVIDGIAKKRPADKQMTTTERENYYKVFEELQRLAEEAGKSSGLGGWIKVLGMLALILGPSVFKIFDEGVEAGGQPAPSG